MRFRVLGKAPNRIVALLVQAAVIAALIGIGVPPARPQLAGAGAGRVARAPGRPATGLRTGSAGAGTSPRPPGAPRSD